MHYPVWDLPTRLFHWALVGGVALSFYTMKLGGAPFLFPVEIHAKAGYVVMGLLLFRWCWGLVGSPHARFWNFLYGPRRMLTYARRLLTGPPPPYAGHNPLGGLMVMVMLASLTFQAVSGLFLTDDIFFRAPLYGVFGRDVSRALLTLHHLNANLLMGLIAAHLLALVVHRLKGERLVVAMLTGRKLLPKEPEDAPVGATHRQRANPWLLLVSMAVAAAPVIWLWNA
ncbi:cytochrome B [Halomonas campisalis]|uniref:Cytochrome B n=1 Tax=Billgrantia campisalis TaxID=74661 RepID=A0ABS9P5W0_9GAMM|nr:cytochrome b/b6 domain-containing protein [Halomonas campisalis]MCG6657144.1 cytochrome B [Halomonas campisalis]MDR5862329.1 cytochrome b/b6 domain-containing protein [Halomonas campisalis]